MIRTQTNKLLNGLVIAMLLLGFSSTTAWSAGTRAGTTISNQATLTFWIAGTGNVTTNSNITSARVDELIDVDVTWQDGTPVSVTPGSMDQVLTFRMTNTGNGQEQFGLTVDPSLLGDDFNPTAAEVYLDDGDGVFSVLNDTLYDASGKPSLNPDQSITVFIIGDIPADLAGELTGQASLTATSVTFDGVTATALRGFGDMGTTAVRFPEGGADDDTGAYLTTALPPNPDPDPDPDPEPNPDGLTLEKSVSIIGPGNETEPIPGAILSYRITAQYTGTNTAESVVINDPIPENTTYRTGSIRLNDISLTDSSDGDAGAFNNSDNSNNSGNGTINVNLGDLNEESPVQTIIFEVYINQ